ncbi:MAG: RnfABCDGE type electron transport complex subunit G [Clostridia bacterium]|nr:RnfABCDGE type electron transport complex subunit G [Clostridia bacterium]
MTKQANNTETKAILFIAFKLLLICTITASLLAGVNALTAEQIAANVRAEKAAAIASIFPSAAESELVDKQAEGVDELYIVMNDSGELLGYAASVSPLGFGGELDIMVGVSPDGTMAGIQLVSHSETPGLGSRVGDADYLAQYVGKSGILAAGKDIDVISGSTISSKAILEGVNSALAAYDDLFSENDVLTGGAQ